jgi:hypothetical protein
MTPLTFHEYGFASLPSGTYLFFPRPGSGPKAQVPEQGAAAKPERVVLVTNHDGPADVAFSGVASGNTLYVSLEPGVFNEVLKGVTKAQRNFAKEPIGIQFALNAEEALVSLAIDGGAPIVERRESYTAPASRAS